MADGESHQPSEEDRQEPSEGDRQEALCGICWFNLDLDPALTLECECQYHERCIEYVSSVWLDHGSITIMAHYRQQFLRESWNQRRVSAKDKRNSCT